MTSLTATPSRAAQRSRHAVHRLALVDAVARTGRLPQLRTGTLRRERLLRRLALARDVPLALVVAPAGYGKTTLLAHWLQVDPRDAAWICVDESHDDPACLSAAIARGLDEERTSAELPQSLQCRKRPVVVVLDDAHKLRSSASLGVVRAIANALPPGSQLVLASRREPELPIGRLRAEGRLIEIRSGDLVATRQEAAIMLSLAGLDLPPEDVLTLLQRTEGWPAGLYLAAVALQGRPGTRRCVSRFGGDDRLVTDYLLDEVLAALEEDERAFLKQTCVLDELSGPVCDALLDATGSGHVLRDMSRSNVLIKPLDHHDRTYRYHGLLVQMLRAELHRVEPELETELRRRASRLYADAGDIDRAIEYAIRSGDVQRSGKLLWTSGADHVLHGRDAVVRRWLQSFTRDQLAATPTLALTAAASHLVRGDRDLVEHWTAAAERSLGEAGSVELDASILMMRAAVAREGTATMGMSAQRAYEALGDDSPWRSLCRLLSGVHEHLRGAPGAARPHLEEGARRGAIAAPAIQVLCLAQLALIAIHAGDWEEARRLAARARAQVERVGLADYPPCALVFAVSAVVRAHRERVEDARVDCCRATGLLTMLVDYVPWYEAETRVALAHAALRFGDVAATRTLLGEATRLLTRAGDAKMLKTWIDDLWSQAESFTIRERVRPFSLTTAELRILALMPTHLSFREMGAELHVSANTIKTHAHAIYRKLDVCSRSETVARARQLGLLGTAAETSSDAARLAAQADRAGL